MIFSKSLPLTLQPVRTGNQSGLTRQGSPSGHAVTPGQAQIKMVHGYVIRAMVATDFAVIVLPTPYRSRHRRGSHPPKWRGGRYLL
jgi:hypothetical protein